MDPIAIAILTIAALALAAGLLLGLAYRRLPATEGDLVERVNSELPQTQCAQCGFPGCRPYAEAIVSEDAPINLCPPGGEATIQRIAELLGREPLPLETAPPEGIQVAIIDEQRCIGCTYCRAACPVDAIVGAHRFSHTVIASECTGCELCIAPCPVDCIDLKRVA